MKQKALHQFTHQTIKGKSRCMYRPMAALSVIYFLCPVLTLLTAWLLLTQTTPNALSVLLWCIGRILLAIAATLLAARCKVHLYIRCLDLLELSHSYLRAGFRRLVRLSLWKGLLRLLLDTAMLAAVIGAILLLRTASMQEEGIYSLMGAVQALPVLLVLLTIRLRWEMRFAAAEVLCVRFAENSALRTLREARLILSGQYGFVLRVILRCIPVLLLPRAAMTLTSYFSVRQLEFRQQA